jgi:general secretion pathway protein D
MKKIIVTLVFLASLAIANSNYDVTLKAFADKVSKSNNIIIYLDQDIKTEKISVFIPGKIAPGELLNLFKRTIKNNNYRLITNGKNIYYLSKRVDYKTKNYIYSLKYSSSKDCSSLLSMMGVKYKYLDDSNTFIIKSNDKRYPGVKRYLDIIDNIQKQVMLKIIIFEFTDSDLKERGVQFGSIYKDISNNIKYALNSIIFPINTNDPLLSSSSFYAAMRLLNETKTITVKQYPYILVKNNKSFKFEAVENIPYLISSTVTQAANVSEQNSIEYKDIGLKINGRSLIHKDFVTLDLDLTIEDIIDGTDQDNMPHTYKRFLKSNTNVNYNQVLLLSGIKRTKNISNEWAVPFISNIPYLGEVFKYRSHSKEVINITIAIQVLNKDGSTPSDFSFCEPANKKKGRGRALSI